MPQRGATKAFGFRVVMLIALAVYLLAIFTLARIKLPANPA